MKKINICILLSTVLVLAGTKLFSYLFIHSLPREVSWIPTFLAYYFFIVVSAFIIHFFTKEHIIKLSYFSPVPFPGIKEVVLYAIIPALLPITMFIGFLDQIPVYYFVLIFLFAFFNSFFEEFFWRGLLSLFTFKSFVVWIISGTLFSFSHFLFWGYWFRTPMVIIPTLISTFIMGLLWMKYSYKSKNIFYPIASHFFVDIFNMSVAIYVGIIPKY